MCSNCRLNECSSWRNPCLCHCHDDEAQPDEGYEEDEDE